MARNAYVMVVAVLLCLVAAAVAHNDGSCWTGAQCDNDPNAVAAICGDTYCVKNYQDCAASSRNVTCDDACDCHCECMNAAAPGAAAQLQTVAFVVAATLAVVFTREHL